MSLNFSNTININNRQFKRYSYLPVSVIYHPVSNYSNDADNYNLRDTSVQETRITRAKKREISTYIIHCVGIKSLNRFFRKEKIRGSGILNPYQCNICLFEYFSDLLTNDFVVQSMTNNLTIKIDDLITIVNKRYNTVAL